MKKLYAFALSTGLLIPFAGFAAETYTVDPPQGYVNGIHIVQVKFDGAVELTDGCYLNAEELIWGNAQLNPRFITDEGYAAMYGPAIFCNELFKVVDGNTLYMERAIELTPSTDLLAGSTWFKIWIKGGCYTLDGKPGEDIWIRYVFEKGVWVAEPESGTPLTFNDDITKVEVDFLGQDVSLVEGAETDVANGIYGTGSLQPVISFDNGGEMIFSNYLYKIEDGKMLLEFNTDINALPEVGENDYATITIKGESFVLNGEEGEDIDLTYIINMGSGIRKVFGDEALLDVTDLQGRQIVKQGRAEDLQGLKGLYIVNGRKVLF